MEAVLNAINHSWMPRLRLREILSTLAARRRATEPTSALVYKAAKSGQFAKLEVNAAEFVPDLIPEAASRRHSY